MHLEYIQKIRDACISEFCIKDSKAILDFDFSLNCSSYKNFNNTSQFSFSLAMYAWRKSHHVTVLKFSYKSHQTKWFLELVKNTRALGTARDATFYKSSSHALGIALHLLLMQMRDKDIVIKFLQCFCNLVLNGSYFPVITEALS